MIQLTDIRKAYRTGNNLLQVLKGIDLHIGKGELVSIMGCVRIGQKHLAEHHRDPRYIRQRGVPAWTTC